MVMTGQPPLATTASKGQASVRTGAQLVCESLLAHGVDLLFGYPGGAALPLYHYLVRYPLRHILVRHEQNAAHAADGYARATGRPGVCVTTSGPGATNLVTGLATAWMDSVPLVALTCQVPTGAIGTLAFQEVDMVSIARPVTKGAYRVLHASDLPEVFATAFAEAQAGRPGPVVVELPRDVMAADVRYDRPLPVADAPAAAAPTRQFAEAVRRVAELLDRAERPVLVVGRGVLLAGGCTGLQALAERLNLPVAYTLLGISAFPDDHPLSLGMVGMHGTVAANLALHHADLVVGVGMRFDDRVGGRAADFAPQAQVVHVDVDPEAFGRVVRADLPVLGDARRFLELLDVYAKPDDRRAWWARLRAWRDTHAHCGVVAAGKMPTTPRVVQALRALSEEADGKVPRNRTAVGHGRVTVVADVGQHQMFVARHYGFQRPGSFFTAGGLGTLGYAVPAAMGVQLARPGETVWAVVGDGGFQMSVPELSTLAAERIPVKIAVINNRFLGMVRQWQELFYDCTYAHSELPQPDFARLARAYGCLGLRVTRASKSEDAIVRALSHAGPAVIDFRVLPEEVVYPMVPPGASLGELVCAEGRV